MPGATGAADGSPDQRLQRVFACCDDRLRPQQRIALLLQMADDRGTPKLARSLGVSEPVVAGWIATAERTVAAEGADARPLDLFAIHDRLGSVLEAVHQLSTAGFPAPSDSAPVRPEPVAAALSHARLLSEHLPGESEATALLALLLLTDARSPARGAGAPVPLDRQDRSLWDRETIGEGTAVLERALTELGGGAPGAFLLRAAIAAAHTDAPSFAETDWDRISGLLDVLVESQPTVVVRQERAAARGESLARQGRTRRARAAFVEAARLTENTVERARIAQRLAHLDAA